MTYAAADDTDHPRSNRITLHGPADFEGMRKAGRLTAEAQARKEAVSGVNLDEEAAALLRHQQAYQACAKLLQTSQSLFESLMSATGR